MRGRYLAAMIWAVGACSQAAKSRIQVLPSVPADGIQTAEPEGFGSLVATVTNADTAALPNAQVALTTVDSFKAVWRIAVATAPGEYRLDSIPPGRYTVRTAAIGFLHVRRRLSLAGGKTLRLHIRLMPHAMCMDYCR